jgi:hypothetical protein
MFGLDTYRYGALQNVIEIVLEEGSKYWKQSNIPWNFSAITGTLIYHQWEPGFLYSESIRTGYCTFSLKCAISELDSEKSTTIRKLF